MNFPLRWEILSSDEIGQIRSLLIPRQKAMAALDQAPAVAQVIGPRGSGKTALVYQTLQGRNGIAVVQGWQVPSTPQDREAWFSVNQKCQMVLIEDFNSSFGADAIAFIAAARASSLRVVVTTTTRVHIPGAVDIFLPDLTSLEAAQLLRAHNAVSREDQRLSETTIESIVKMTPRLKTPRALLTLAHLCLRDESLTPEHALCHVEGPIYGHPTSLNQSDPNRIIVVSSMADLMRELRKEPDSLFRMPSRRFEEVVAELLRDRGCIVHLTPSTRDGGFDMYAFCPTPVGQMLCLVEAKRYSPSRPIGLEIIRELYGTLCSHDANSAMLVTTSRFTPDAREFQNKFQQVLALRDYIDLAQWISSYGATGTAV